MKAFPIYSGDLGREATSEHKQHKNQITHVVHKFICKLPLKEMSESWGFCFRK
jgi:hypothetical protein